MMALSVHDAAIFAREKERKEETIVSNGTKALEEKLDEFIRERFRASSPEIPMRYEITDWSISDPKYIMPILNRTMEAYRKVGWLINHTGQRGGGAGTLEFHTSIHSLPAEVCGPSDA